MSTNIKTLFDLSGKTALVTGGSRGLGLQIAEALGEAGARILLTSRKASDLEQAAAHLQAKGIDTRWVVVVGLPIGILDRGIDFLSDSLPRQTTRDGPGD